MFFYIITILALFVTFAMTVREGMWSNLLLLCYLMLSSAIAFGYYQPLTIFLDEMLDGQYTYLLDMLVFWAIFALAITVLKTVGVTLSDTKVKFLHLLEQYGGPAVGFLCGLVMASVVGMSLHMAMLGKDTMGGALVHAEGVDSPSLLTSKPDIGFLAAASLFTAPTGMGDGGDFDPGLWVEDYAKRRERFEKLMKSAKAAWELKAQRSGKR